MQWSSLASVYFMLQISTFIFTGITGSQSSITAVCLVETLPNYSVPVQHFKSLIFALRQSGAAGLVIIILLALQVPQRRKKHSVAQKGSMRKLRLLKFRSSVIGVFQLSSVIKSSRQSGYTTNFRLRNCCYDITSCISVLILDGFFLLFIQMIQF